MELQSCANLVNAAALCAIENGVKGESVSLIAEISAELKREKKKNAELMERISILEAQIRERDKDPLVSNRQVYCQNSIKNKSKKQKLAAKVEKFDVEDIRMSSEMKPDMQSMPDKHLYKQDLNWMGLDETEILTVSDSALDIDDTDDSIDEDGELDDKNGFCADHKGQGNNKEVICAKELKENLLKQEVDGEADVQNLVSSSSANGEPTSAPLDQEIHECLIEKRFSLGENPIDNLRESKHLERKDTTMTGGQQEASTCIPGEEIKRCENMVMHKKPPKIAFCPKEVKRILDSGELLLKNAQSHTIRKIIVFSSLGIRHGCEDMYELDFNHFSILRKGEPYISPEDPGEHVLYENPGVRRKIFYPNRQTPTLCPVQILEEEKAMRPSDASCPSCLFLCIKYGGRSRNVPQNEYVRQRMGRNKLKSLGPAICQMAMLVHIRSGSFFFKALGITLLFMAGYPDDLVQKETKYRNLDLVQKYYRTDEDAEGEELFLPQPVNIDTNDSLTSRQLSTKTISTRLKCKRNTDSASKESQDKTSSLRTAPSNSGTSSHFELKGYASIQNQAITTTAHSIRSPAPADTSSLANPLMGSKNPSFLHYDPLSYPMFPPHPANSFVPLMYWHPPASFFQRPHPSSHTFRHPIAGNYISIYPQPYYGIPTLVPNPLKDSENANCDSKSSSSSTELKRDETS